MKKKLKSTCCKKYRKKSKACSSCPIMARLKPRERAQLIAEHSERRCRKSKKTKKSKKAKSK